MNKPNEYEVVSGNACPHCGWKATWSGNTEFMGRLTELLRMIETDIEVTSLTRCPIKNLRTPRASRSSLHMLGMAADLVFDPAFLPRVRAAAESLGFDEIIWYPRSKHLHVGLKAWEHKLL